MAVKYEEEEHIEIQMTSMMDCIFLMLIFFLVSSQLKKVEKELPIELPRANTTRDVKSTPDLITVSVNAKGELFVNSKPVGDAGLKNALANAAKENPDRRIRINGDVFAPFRSIVQVLDTCQGEGLTVVGIHTATDIR
ncbi:MAG: biopolymer transporter ExbD [Kiritimatiellae bacterium]|jgi:biopolymer transport protein ExbD|nr:biopolymer transporter ExbD [Kiritimatiellia bacterium]MBQ2623657.1 biopolymer transporter ExbD [Kiritimatiellia bacterium]MBR0241163.1 biopolymer transporter ExbD [Kiritimatiellia bacterium]